MNTDLDTLLVALYVLVDDHVIPPHRRRPGRPQQLTDAELVCLAVAQVLLDARSERRWLRMCRQRLGHLFPYLPQQPGYHKRLKAAAPLICRTILYLATLCPSWGDQLRLIDATPIPCGTSRETVKRSRLAGLAGYGYCAAHSRWYWGLKLYLITTREGMPVAWCLANPKLGEREVAEELFGHAHDLGVLRPGMIVLADKGLSGKELEGYTAEQFGLLLVHPDRKDATKRRYGNLGGMRQWIEAIINTGKDQLDLEGHRGRQIDQLQHPDVLSGLVTAKVGVRPSSAMLRTCAVRAALRRRNLARASGRRSGGASSPARSTISSSRLPSHRLRAAGGSVVAMG